MIKVSGKDSVDGPIPELSVLMTNLMITTVRSRDIQETLGNEELRNDL
jgi:hypothetical protein